MRVKCSTSTEGFSAMACNVTITGSLLPVTGRLWSTGLHDRLNCATYTPASLGAKITCEQKTTTTYTTTTKQQQWWRLLQLQRLYNNKSINWTTVKLHYNVLLETGKISTLYPKYVVTKKKHVHTLITNSNTCISNAPIKHLIILLVYSLQPVL